MSRKGKKEINEEIEYDIEAREFDGPVMIGADRPYTEEEIEEMLIGYFEVPRSEWHKMPLRGWCRYVDNEGKFFKGGMIVASSSNEFIQIGWNGTGTYKKLFFNEITKLYKKLAYGAEIELSMCITSIKTLNGHIKSMKTRIDELERKVNNLSVHK